MGFIVKTVNGKTPKIENALYIADYSFIAGDVRLGKNVTIWSNTSLRGDLASIVVGENSNIQENTVVHTSACEDWDCTKNPKGHVIIGNNTTIGHACIIHACRIGNDCLIGMGTVIGDNCIIEDGAFIGADSNLTPRTIVRSGELWFGNPAKFMRKLRDTDYEYIEEGALNYIRLGNEYKK